MALWYKGLPQNGSKAEQQDINYLMLYDAGDECVEVTGGWGLFSNMTAAKRSDSLYLKGIADSAAYYGAFYTNNLINLSGYSKLCAYIDAIAFYNANPANSCCGWGLGSTKENTSPHFNVVNDIANFATTKKGKGLYIGNISTYQSSYYVKFAQSSTREAALYFYFAVKEDNWQTWLTHAGLTVSDYAGLDAVIADNTALTTVMSSKAAVDYMLLHCTGTVMAAVMQSEAALESIADSPYNAQIFSNKHWNKFLRMFGAVPESEKVYLYRYGRYNDNCPIVSLMGKSSVGYDGGTFRYFADKCTKNMIDLTNFTSIKVISKTGTYGNTHIAVSPINTPDIGINWIAWKETDEDTNLHLTELDITDVNGTYFVSVGQRLNTSYNPSWSVTDYGDYFRGMIVRDKDNWYTDIYEIWLER